MCYMGLTSTKLILFLKNSNSGTSAICWIVGSLVLYTLEEITERQIPCPCTSANSNYAYACMVFSIPAVVLLLIAMMFQCKEKYGNLERETWRESLNWRKFVKVISVIFYKSVSLSLIWIGILFLDGDYYACSKKMDNVKVNSTICSKLSCEWNPSIFLLEYGHLCDYSRLIGVGILTTWVVLAGLVLFCPLCQPDEEHQTKHKYHIKFIKETQGQGDTRITETLPSSSTNEDNVISLLKSRLPTPFTATIKTVSDKDESTIEVNYTVRENTTDESQQEAEGS
ncbi:uncharacterized protein LOC122541361 [Chiloscyllium plagiosum]|uniref:uncharacterized protein LOC122541361 n=1 Tax=Chiloscyllium plagiosum TaxID=36176 RepID=UPI001CB7BB3C|nr:uncharacterized protein LOC122541361 [Chiloscyllium plagiosum]XP_043534000.1 uncharacterized protein LOC122541361 [Chiloscyllium plagiosum]XP_043534001.1 uncharacterized protein LOC122541361 [Chiloscyllium plagiosum]